MKSSVGYVIFTEQSGDILSVDRARAEWCAVPVRCSLHPATHGHFKTGKMRDNAGTKTTVSVLLAH